MKTKLFLLSGLLALNCLVFGQGRQSMPLAKKSLEFKTLENQTAIHVSKNFEGTTIKGSHVNERMLHLEERIDGLSGIQDAPVKAQIEGIKQRINATQINLISNENYPSLYDEVISNYTDLIEIASKSKNSDSAKMIVNFIDQDLKLKFAEKADGQMIDPIITVKVVVLKLGDNKPLEGYEIRMRPYLVTDKQAEIQFGQTKGYTSKSLMLLPRF